MADQQWADREHRDLPAKLRRVLRRGSRTRSATERRPRDPWWIPRCTPQRRRVIKAEAKLRRAEREVVKQGRPT